MPLNRKNPPFVHQIPPGVIPVGVQLGVWGHFGVRVDGPRAKEFPTYAGVLSWCPRQESNLCTRIRKPLTHRRHTFCASQSQQLGCLRKDYEPHPLWPSNENGKALQRFVAHVLAVAWGYRGPHLGLIEMSQPTLLRPTSRPPSTRRLPPQQSPPPCSPFANGLPFEGSEQAGKPRNVSFRNLMKCRPFRRRT
jgi:hypothetical protein